MDPNTGRYVDSEELMTMLPKEREKFSVRMEGPEEDVQKISNAVQTARQAEEVLLAIRGYARAVAKSGNPGRAAVGKDILSLLEPR